MLDRSYFQNLGLEEVLDKVLAGERLSVDNGLSLYTCPEPHALGLLASHVREGLHHDRVHYVINRHVNPTNICVNDCVFCAYRREPDAPDAYVLTAEQALEKLGQAGRVDEVHIVGGCHPTLKLSYYEDLCRRVRQALPQASIKALTAVEVAHLAGVEQTSVTNVLARLKAAGVDMMPGGGAEIFAEALRAKLCPAKINGREWLAVMGQAHHLGLASNATMLFGHVESLQDRLEHMDALRLQQDQTHGFKCFIPLPYLAQNNPLGRQALGPSGPDVLRTTAVARLMLDNFPHIKAYWVMLGLKLAQLCLSYGADDLDGTVVEEHIGHEAGSASAQALTIPELEQAIRAAGFTPVRRNGLFEEADGALPRTPLGEMISPRPPRTRAVEAWGEPPLAHKAHVRGGLGEIISPSECRAEPCLGCPSTRPGGWLTRPRCTSWGRWPIG